VLGRYRLVLIHLVSLAVSVRGILDVVAMDHVSTADGVGPGARATANKLEELVAILASG
jgi:hypothetical protein